MVKRVLIADDSRFARSAMKKTLKKIGEFDFTFVSDGDEAIEKVKTEDFDLFFLDLTMVRVQGYEVLATMQEAGITDLPVIVVSADIQPKAIERVVRLGARAFLGKPAKVETVRALLEREDLI